MSKEPAVAELLLLGAAKAFPAIAGAVISAPAGLPYGSEYPLRLRPEPRSILLILVTGSDNEPWFA